jgi:hypothetical protein
MKTRETKEQKLRAMAEYKAKKEAVELQKQQELMSQFPNLFSPEKVKKYEQRKFERLPTSIKSEIKIIQQEQKNNPKNGKKIPQQTDKNKKETRGQRSPQKAIGQKGLFLFLLKRCLIPSSLFLEKTSTPSSTAAGSVASTLKPFDSATLLTNENSEEMDCLADLDLSSFAHLGTEPRQGLISSPAPSSSHTSPSPPFQNQEDHLSVLVEDFLLRAIALMLALV